MVHSDVVEFGPERDGRPRRGAVLRRWQVPARTSRVLGLVGGLTAFASLVTDWRVINVPMIVDGVESVVPFNGLSADELGTLGTTYLVALPIVTGLVCLTLFGLPAVRHTARLAGLGITGTVTAMLVALWYRPTIIDPYGAMISSRDSEAYTQPGTASGLYAALATMILFGAALWFAPPGAEATAEEPQETDEPEEDIGLTVSAAAPFVRPAP